MITATSEQARITHTAIIRWSIRPLTRESNTSTKSGLTYSVPLICIQSMKNNCSPVWRLMYVDWIRTVWVAAMDFRCVFRVVELVDCLSEQLRRLITDQGVYSKKKRAKIWVTNYNSQFCWLSIGRFDKIRGRFFPSPKIKGGHFGLFLSTLNPPLG